jgi:hypothetical protein
MTTLAVSKVLASLPGTLDANMIYLVRVGTGFDLYATDSTGAVAYKSNAAPDRSKVTALAISAGEIGVDCALGDYFTVALTANVANITFSNLPASGSGRTLCIDFTQDATGGRTVALPASFKAIGNSDTAVPSAANAKTRLIISTTDSGATWPYAMAKVAA